MHKTFTQGAFHEVDWVALQQAAKQGKVSWVTMATAVAMHVVLPRALLLYAVQLLLGATQMVDTVWWQSISPTFFGSVVLVTIGVVIFGETAQLRAFLIPQQEQQRGDDFLWLVIFLVGIYALAPLAYATDLGWSGVVVTSTATLGLLRVCRSFHS
jgi:hypothetical protein